MWARGSGGDSDLGSICALAVVFVEVLRVEHSSQGNA